MIAFTTFEPNEPVLLYRGDFELRGAKHPLRATGAVLIRWLPQPRLLFESEALPFDPVVFDIMRSPGIVDIEGNFVCETDRSIVSLKSHDKSLQHDNSKGLFLDLGLMRFERSCNPNIECVFFHVANLEGLHKRDSEGSGASGIRGVLLSGGGWRIQLKTATMNYERLGESGGFALTYMGILERENKESFTTTEAADILDGLYYFLSFVRGSWCWPCLYIGTFASNFCWFRCSEPREIDQLVRPEHFPLTADEALITTSFDGFLKFWCDIEWRKPLQTALSWYVEANRARSMESAVVAGQTALELIAWIHVVERRKMLSAEGFDKLNAPDRFRLLLNLQGIPVDFPPRALDLTTYSAHSHRRWEDGPRAIAELRNSIVHPKKRENLYDASKAVREQARRLTLWYLASAISRLFGYSADLPQV